MDVDATKAQFARGVEESRRILTDMLTKTQANDHIVAKTRQAIQESRGLLCASFDSGQ